LSHNAHKSGIPAGAPEAFGGRVDRAGQSSVQAAAGIVLVIDKDGRVRAIDVARTDARLAADLREGETLADHLHPDDREFFALSKHWVRVPGNAATPPIRLRWARGGGNWAAVNVTLSAEGPDTVRVAVARDEAETAWRAEKQLRGLVEGSLQGIVVRSEKEVFFMNDAFARLLGYASAKDMSTRMSEWGPNVGIHPDDAKMVAERVRQRVAGNEPPAHYELRMIRRDGSMIWVDALAARVTWNGKPASLSWLTDITARKQMEAELRRSKDAAEFANRSKTEFLANMSHELRTPLNAILGFAEVIRDELFGPAGQPKYVDYAGDIVTSGQHLLDLINDLLDLSKLEAGRMELHESNIAVPKTVRYCTKLLQDRAQASGISLITEVADDVPDLWADERAFRQVLLNFLSNAIKFTPKGGKVTARVTHAPDKGLAIAVSDTGIGMSPEDIEIAMTPFGQVDSYIARQHKGTGLGLPISQALMKLHGGEVRIESAPNRGTTTTATFPAARLTRKTVAA
jgi:PAS domain S-box-containing protein